MVGWDEEVYLDDLYGLHRVWNIAERHGQLVV